MAFKLLSLNSLVKRRKPKDDIDELAIVKAAAWAWYQHGSGSERKAMSEFDITRIRREPKPSRYKLEAMRLAQESSVTHSKNSLLDKYEVQSISRRLDSLIESSHNKISNGLGDSDYPANARLDNCSRRMMMTKKKKKKMGRSEDLVDGRAPRDDHLPASRVPVVNLAKCMPRAKSLSYS